MKENRVSLTYETTEKAYSDNSEYNPLCMTKFTKCYSDGVLIFLHFVIFNYFPGISFHRVVVL